MSGGLNLESFAGWQDPRDYGARGDGVSADSWAIQAAIAAARDTNGSGGRICIRPSKGAYLIDRTILTSDNLEIYLPRGATLQLAPGSLLPNLIQDTGATRLRIWGGGRLLGDFLDATHAGISLAGSSLVTIEDLDISGFGDCGIAIAAASDVRLLNVICHENGWFGIRVSAASTRTGILGSRAYNNGRFNPGVSAGVFLQQGSIHTNIVDLHAFDNGAPFGPCQDYPILGDPGSGSDFTIVAGLQSTGHVVSNSPSLDGANSKWLDSAATVALAGLPSSVASAKVLGASVVAAPLDHVHDLASGLTVPSPVVTGRLQQARGADVPSANNLTLGPDGNYFRITGTTQINLLDATLWQDGSVVILRFNGACTVKHNQGPSTSFRALQLLGAADFVAADGSTLTLVLESGVSGSWWEIGRKAT